MIFRHQLFCQSKCRKKQNEEIKCRDSDILPPTAYNKPDALTTNEAAHGELM